MANKQHRRHPHFSIISDPLAREEEWLPLIGNGDWIGLDDSKKPSSRPLSKKRAALLGVVSLMLCGLILQQSWPVIFQAHKERPKIAQAGQPDQTDVDAPVPQPAFLRGILPKVVTSLSIQNVSDRNGNYKLVAWSEHFGSMWIGLVEARAGKSRLVWRSGEYGFYCPQIITLPGCNWRGQPVYVVLGQGGAAWQIARPVCVHDGSVHTFAPLESMVFDVEKISGKQHLVGLDRYGVLFPCREGRTVRAPQVDLKFRCIYELKGNDFVVVNSSYPEFYQKLFNEDYAGDSRGDWCNQYSIANSLYAAGCENQSRPVFEKVACDVAKSRVPELQFDCFDKLSKLGCKQEALVLALALQQGMCHGGAAKHLYFSIDETNDNTSNILLDAVVLMDKGGRKKEALALLEKIRKYAAGSKSHVLARRYKLLLARMKENSN